MLIASTWAVLQISQHRLDGKRIAFDICPVNIVLNELARKTGKEFDEGRLKRVGVVFPISPLVNELNSLEYLYAKRTEIAGQGMGGKDLLCHCSTNTICRRKIL